MTRLELETWLCGEGAARPTRAEIAALLGIALVSEEWLARARFTIAVLRDRFADDRGVRRWLHAPQPALGGRTGLDLLRNGQSQTVEALAVREWHRPTAAPFRARRAGALPPRHRPAPTALGTLGS